MTNTRTNMIRICFAIGATLAASTAFAQGANGGGGGGANGGGAGNGGDGAGDIIAFFHQDKQGWKNSANCTFGGCQVAPVVQQDVCGDRARMPAYVGQGSTLRIACVRRPRR